MDSQFILATTTLCTVKLHNRRILSDSLLGGGVERTRRARPQRESSEATRCKLSIDIDSRMSRLIDSDTVHVGLARQFAQQLKKAWTYRNFTAVTNKTKELNCVVIG